MAFTNLRLYVSKVAQMRISSIAFSILFFTLSVSAQLSISVTKTDPRCFGYTNGTASATATGGLPPYTYAWSNGSAGSNLFGLNKGTFSITVTDAANKTATSSVTIVEPSQVNTTFKFADVCNGGSITATGTGGVIPYAFAWGSGKTGTTQTLAQGGYNVTLTDANGCSMSNFLNVPGAFSLNLKIGKLRCFGDCDAAVDALPQGGTFPFTYKWNNGAVTQSIVGIPAGTYSVTATDANGCTSVASGTVINPPQITVTTSVVSPSCGGGANGSATANVTGGVAPFTYLWSNGQKTATATGLNVGNYTVTATDANGCSRMSNVIIATQANFTVNVAKTDAACGSTNGSATVNAIGTSGVVSYKWSTGAISQTISGIAAGSYTVTVMDGSGCSNVGSVTVNSTGGNLAATVQKADASCGIANGIGMVIVSSGTAPYMYKWNTGATDASLKNLSAGNYIITVTDAAGCSAILNFSIASTTSLTVTADSKNVTCNGGNDGQITAMVSGGSAPYFYSWSTGSTVNTVVNLKAGSYSVTVKDNIGCIGNITAAIAQPDAISIKLTTGATNCNSSNGNLSAAVIGGSGSYKYQWSNGATTQSITNLAAGSYTLTVTDSKNCTAAQSATVSSSSGVAITVNVSNPVCSDGFGAATANVSGGATPYKYAWSSGASTPSINGLSGGNYMVSVTDNNGCIAVQNFAVNTPLPITVSVSALPTSCSSNNGSASATLVNGGTAPFAYLWNTGSKTALITNLAAGTYIVTVTDANGCTAKNSASVAASSATTISITSTNVKCNGGSEGTATASVSDNTSPYQYVWSNGTKTATISNLAAGTYTVTATNAAGCSASGSVTITQGAAIALSTTSTSASCLPVGSATVTASGGVAPYVYKWSNGANTASITNILGGTYTVTVTDANGCSVNTNVTVQAVTSPNFTVTATVATAITDQGSASGAATATVSGGVSPFTYLWSNNYSQPTIINLAAGTYKVTVTDKNGCTATASVTLVDAVCSQVTDPGTISGNQTICQQADIQTITSITPAKGGSGALQYMWMYSTVASDFSLSHYVVVPGSGNTPNLSVFPIINQVTYIRRCVRNAGCGNYLESNAITITPVVNAVITGPTNVCLGNAATFSTPNTGASSIVWLVSNGTNPNGTGTSITSKFITIGVKPVTVTITKNGCVRTASLNVNSNSCFGQSGTISAFTAVVKNPKNIRLDWQTTNELIPSQYVVEHSADGINYDLMVNIPSQNTAQNDYTLVDDNPIVGHNFYRIKHLEGNGDISYSDIRESLIFSAQGDVIMYPNPVSSKLYIETMTDTQFDGTIEVFNSYGRLMTNQTFTKDQIRYEVDLSNLPSGIFILRITTSNGVVKSLKVNRS